MKAQVLIAGEAQGEVQGEVLALTHPISFWGGVNPKTGDIIDARHPERGQNIAGKILALPAMIGSSSAAAVMLELIHAGKAPKALIMPDPDAILLLGVIVAQEMEWSICPAFALDKESQRALHGKTIKIERDGEIRV